MSDSCLAMAIGVLPFLSAIVASAPLCSSALAMSPRPLKHTHHSAVRPKESRWLTVDLAAGWLSSKRTTSSLPSTHATIQGVEPPSSAMVGSAPRSAATVPQPRGRMKRSGSRASANGHS
jgi:hypothetical protein